MARQPFSNGVRMGRKSAMAFPSSPCGAGSQPTTSHGSADAAPEGDHQLEKLEFALAVALTRGDVQRSEQLRHQIAALGGNREEPGT